MQTEDTAPEEASFSTSASALFPTAALAPDVVADISFAEAQRAEKTIRRLKRGNPVRKLARDVMNRRVVGDARPLFASLTDTARPAQEREIAAWTLGWTPLDTEQQVHAAALLRDVLEGEQAPDPMRWQRILRRTLALSAPLIFLLLLQLQYHHPYTFHFSYLLGSGYYARAARPIFVQICLGISLLVLLPTAPTSLLLDRRRNNRVRAAAAMALGRLQSVEAVGALTTALYDRSATVRRAATAALKNILPLLSEAHYGQLGVQVIPNLCRALQQNDEMLVLHVLSALEQVGDGRAVRPIEQMVKSGRTERLRNLAARVLPILQERQQQEKASKMLLRAATPLAPGAEMLLRAVAAPMSEAVVSGRQTAAVPAAQSGRAAASSSFPLPSASPASSHMDDPQTSPSESQPSQSAVSVDAYAQENTLPQQLKQGRSGE